MAGLHFVQTSDNSQLLASLRQSQAAMAQLGAAAEQTGSSIDDVMGRVKGIAGQIAGIAGIGLGGFTILNQIKSVRSEFQNTEAMFKVFLKDGERAAAFMKEMQDYSWNNVFDFGDLTKQAAQLLAYGTDVSDITTVIDRLSNVAAGTNGSLAELVATYNRVKSTDTIDSRIREILAEAQGVTEEEMRGVTLHFEDLNKALEAVTDEGGLYAGIMYEKMKTLGDSVGLLEDRVTQMFNDMGKEIQEPLREIIYNLADLAGAWTDIIPYKPIKAGIEMIADLSGHLQGLLPILSRVAMGWGVMKAAQAMQKAYNNVATKQALLEEKATLDQLIQTDMEYQRQLLQQSVASLQAKDATDALTNSEREELARKEAALNSLEMQIELKEQQASGKITEARAEEIQREYELIEAKRASYEQEIQQTDDEINSINDLIAAREREIEQADEAKAAAQAFIDAATDQTDASALQAAQTDLQTASEYRELAAQQLETLEKQKAAAMERRDTLERGRNAAATGVQTIQERIHTKSLQIRKVMTDALKRSVDRLNAAMKANPIGFVLSMIPMVISLIEWLTGLGDQEHETMNAVDELNEAYDERVGLIRDAYSEGETLVNQLANEKTAVDALNVAYEGLVENISFFRDNDLLTASGDAVDLEKLSSFIEKYGSEEVKKMMQQSKLKDIENESKEVLLGAVRYYMATLTAKKSVTRYNAKTGESFTYETNQNYYTPEQQTAALEAAKATSSKYFTAVQAGMKGLDNEAKKKAYLEVITKMEEYTKQYGESAAVVFDGIKTDAQGAIDALEESVNTLPKVSVKSLNDELKVAKEGLQNLDINDVEYAKKRADYERQIYDLTRRVGALQQDPYKLAEERKTAMLKAQNERISIEQGRIENEQLRRRAELNQKIAQIEQEAAKWQKDHYGARSEAYKKQIENVRLQFQLDTEKADKQFADWKKSFERETLKIVYDIETSALEQQLKTETDINEQLRLQGMLRDRQAEQIRRQASLESRQAMEKDYGADMYALFSRWSQQGDTADKRQLAEQYAEQIGVSVEDVEAELIKMSETATAYARKAELQLQQEQQKGEQTAFNDMLSRLEDYYNERLQIEQDYQDAVKSIRETEDLNAADRAVRLQQAKTIRDEKVRQVDTTIATSDNADFARSLVSLSAQTATMAFEQVKTIYEEFLATLDDDITTLESKVNTLSGYQSSEDVAAGVQEMTKRLEGDEGMTEEERNDLLEQRLALQTALTDMQQQGLTYEQYSAMQSSRLVTLKNGQKNAQKQYTEALGRAQQQEVNSLERQRRQFSAAVEGLNSVKTMANAVADTFAGALSKKAKKALDTVSDIVDFATQSIQSIQYVSENASKLMQATAEASAQSMSTLEKASVILTVIQMAIQAAMQIANIVKRFTASARLQEQIDNQLERVEELKRKQDQLERQYKNDAGTRYYKRMAKAAENYNTILEANREALRKANELEEEQRKKHGRDSDKYKDAKKQREDIEDEQQELLERQRELYQQLADDLLTTDVSSFASNFADSLVDAWTDGTKDIRDVWETMLDDLQRSMMKKALTTAIEDMFQDTFKRVSSLASDGALTQAEIDFVIDELAAKAHEAEVVANRWQRAMEERGLLDETDIDATRGGFQSMSQDTADELTARFTALQIEGANVATAAGDIRTTINQLLEDAASRTSLLTALRQNSDLAVQQAEERAVYLRQIQDNTAMLAETNLRLRAIEQNTDRL